MAKVNVTKARIARAIAKEPVLTPGAWASMVKDAKARLDPDDLYTGFDETMLKKLKTKSKDCAVCAVGAVMRDILDPSQNACAIENASEQAVTGPSGYLHEFDIAPVIYTKEDRKGLYKNAKETVAAGAPMAALSMLFEGLSSYYRQQRNSRELTTRDLAQIRRSVVAFVQTNFPYKVTIDIDGARPAKDVKKVKKASAVRL